MQMRGNLHRYRVSPSRKKNRMLQGTFLPSYSPVLKNAGYGLLLTLLDVQLAKILGTQNECKNQRACFYWTPRITSQFVTRITSHHLVFYYCPMCFY